MRIWSAVDSKFTQLWLKVSYFRWHCLVWTQTLCWSSRFVPLMWGRVILSERATARLHSSTTLHESGKLTLTPASLCARWRRPIESAFGKVKLQHSWHVLVFWTLSFFFSNAPRKCPSWTLPILAFSRSTRWYLRIRLVYITATFTAKRNDEDCSISGAKTAVHPELLQAECTAYMTSLHTQLSAVLPDETFWLAVSPRWGILHISVDA